MVAELDGRIVRSNFLDERATIFSVGPISVDPEVQDHHIGRALMEAVLSRCAELSPPGVRLLQSAYYVDMTRQPDAPYAQLRKHLA